MTAVRTVRRDDLPRQVLRQITYREAGVECAYGEIEMCEATGLGLAMLHLAWGMVAGSHSQINKQWNRRISSQHTQRRISFSARMNPGEYQDHHQGHRVDRIDEEHEDWPTGFRAIFCRLLSGVIYVFGAALIVAASRPAQKEPEGRAG